MNSNRLNRLSPIQVRCRAARGPKLFLRQEAGRPPNHSSAAVSEFRLQRRLDTPTAACTRGGAGSSTISVAPPAGIWCRSGDGHGPLHWGLYWIETDVPSGRPNDMEGGKDQCP